jgi:RNA polymerase sigma-70 factor (ECF subfamily)
LDNSSSESDTNDTLHDRYAVLVCQYRNRLFAYLLTLVGDRQDAEDLLQEVFMLTWRKFDEYEQGSDFMAWAGRIAYLSAKNFKRKRQRRVSLLDADAMKLVADDAVDMVPQLVARRDALQYCLSKLPERERALLVNRYESGGSVSAAAAATSRSYEAAKKALVRIRGRLRDCIDTRVRAEALG